MKSSKTVFLKRIIFFRYHKEEIDFYSVLNTVFILQKLNKHSISIETSHVIPSHQIVGRGSTSCPSQWGEGSCCDVWWHWAHFIVLTNHNWTKLWTDNSCSHSRTEHSEDTGLPTLLSKEKALLRINSYYRMSWLKLPSCTGERDSSDPSCFLPHCFQISNNGGHKSCSCFSILLSSAPGLILCCHSKIFRLTGYVD